MFDLALEVREFFEAIDGELTDAHLAEMNNLLDRAREIMMNRARAYTRFDTDQVHIHNNDLQLAQMLGIDKEYIQEKIKNKIKMSANDITGTIELPDGDTVTFNFIVGSGTLALTSSGDTVIVSKYAVDSLWSQLEKADIVFEVEDANDRRPNDEQLLTQDYPLIIGDGIAEIGNNAFHLSNALRSVYFMGQVRSIDENAFGWSERIVEVGFAYPESLKFIYSSALLFDSVLVSINTP